MLISGSKFIFCVCVSGAALVQGFHLGSSHVSHGGFHVGGSLGRVHHMRSGRHVMVLGPRFVKRHSLVDTRLPIFAPGSQPRASRALFEALQALQGQQKAFPRVGKGGKDTQVGFRSDLRDGRNHASG